MKKIEVRRLLALFSVLLISGCMPAVGPGGGAEGAQVVSPLLVTCPAGSGGRMQCLEEQLLDSLRVHGIASAMETLERIGVADAEIRRDGHVYAHVIGLAAYSGPDEVGRAFAECTPAFQSGCYHGIIQSYFAELASSGAAAVTEAQVNGLCADYRGDPASNWLLFQCAHGMGHGLTMVEGYHLPSALAACDLLSSPWERDACHGGVFMESIINEIAPHHTGRPGHEEHGGHQAHAADAGQAARRPAPAEMDHDAHAHHEHHEHAAVQPAGAGRAPFPALDPGDHHYPCSALDARYQQSCYMMQTSVVLHHTQGDFAAAAAMCDSAPTAHRETCYQSLGRDASSYAVQVHRKGLELCAVGDRTLQRWCHVGYVKNVIDVTANPADGFSYCQLVRAGEAKEHCYRAVGQQIYLLAGSPEARAAHCAGAEAGYVAQCRAGADLPDQPATAR
jgi:hypothetical protein